MNTAENNGYKKLDKSKLNNRRRTIVPSEVALKDIVPINWSDEVLNGEKKVLISTHR